jgi:cytochrome P450
MAGADTTAAAFRGTMLHIITNPSVYNALLSEISQASRHGAISSPIRDSEAQQLPYLQAVIREGLRIFPPVAAYAPREAPPGGDTISGKHVPAGTRLGFTVLAMLRQKHVFGNDADIFRPERWLEASPEARSEMEKALMMVFNGGKWTCLGKSVALIELNKIYVEVLRRFDVAIVDPTKTWTSINWVVFINKGMFVRVTKRKEKI